MSTKTQTKKWVYLFREGDRSMRDLLGGKGAGLAEMTKANLPVPSGFTITTEACNAYYAAGERFPDGMWEQTQAALKEIEERTGKRLGDAIQPLLVSVRSGGRDSMPGMMDTVLNLGMNRETLQGIAQASGNERFAYDAYRRFIQMFGRIVLGLEAEGFEKTLAAYKKKVGAALDTDLTTAHLQEISEQFLAIVQQHTKQPFPQDAHEQLRLAIRAVFASWNGKRAVDYRNFYGIAHNLGTAVNVVAMVFGNMGENSGTGVAFTRDPATGERKLYGEFLMNAQGEDVVAGIRTPLKIEQMSKIMPAQHQEIIKIAAGLEKHYRDSQDMEFTIEDGKLYMLQTRSAKRTAQAAIRMAVEMAGEGLITRAEALQRVEPLQINQVLLPRFGEGARKQAKLLAKGINASPGAASGKVVFDPNVAQAMGRKGESVILVRPETNPDDVHGMLEAKGILTARGGATSHAAVVARGLGKPCVAGVEGLAVEPERHRFEIHGTVVMEGEQISIDGTTGEVFAGSLPTTEPRLSEEKDLVTLLQWADGVRRLGVRANADYPRDAQRAVEFGAEGVGLCRTEHMFFEEERLPHVRRMILTATEATQLEAELAMAEAAANGTAEAKRALEAAREHVAESATVKEYQASLERLLAFQTEDFYGILLAMDGKPVIIRLLDPPLHEFLPRFEDLLVEVTTLRITGKDAKALREKEALLAAVEEMREANPMLGLRGCRLGLMFGAINQMQARAIYTAGCRLLREGKHPRPEIMVPLVGVAKELELVREEITRVGAEVQREFGVTLAMKIGTMIEVPRAAVTADEIAKHADFFSFGTNDLTQTTFGYSRDDAEGKFLLHYVERGILPNNPFQVLDRGGVGKLITMARELGLGANPKLEMGICGEHGGDPSSIAFCHQAGLDYVSASPFRVPVARLAAAQAALQGAARPDR
ncbi:MAG: pyruvate, phosphate dikinase [Dehalococcoidia bacterium]|nr:pyruvate, phosphate dikinase [Dehalococcoidia bacterium]